MSDHVTPAWVDPGHEVRFRCPGRPMVPVILRHPADCDPTDCEFGRTLADRFEAGEITWVDGVYRQERASASGGTMLRLGSWAQRMGEPFFHSEATYLAMLRGAPDPAESVPASIGDIAPWPMWVEVTSELRGWLWTARYGYDLLEVERQFMGGNLGWVAWGRRGRARLIAKLRRRHEARFGPPPVEMVMSGVDPVVVRDG